MDALRHAVRPPQTRCPTWATCTGPRWASSRARPSTGRGASPARRATGRTTSTASTRRRTSEASTGPWEVRERVIPRSAGHAPRRAQSRRCACSASRLQGMPQDVVVSDHAHPHRARPGVPRPTPHAPLAQAGQCVHCLPCRPSCSPPTPPPAQARIFSLDVNLNSNSTLIATLANKTVVPLIWAGAAAKQRCSSGPRPPSTR